MKKTKIFLNPLLIQYDINWTSTIIISKNYGLLTTIRMLFKQERRLNEQKTMGIVHFDEIHRNCVIFIKQEKTWILWRRISIPFLHWKISLFWNFLLDVRMISSQKSNFYPKFICLFLHLGFSLFTGATSYISHSISIGKTFQKTSSDFVWGVSFDAYMELE